MDHHINMIPIAIRTASALRPGDYFDPSGNFDQDAGDLGRIYEISDTRRWMAELVNENGPTRFNLEGLRDCLTDAHPAASHAQIVNFLHDCRRSIVAHAELWSD